MFRKALNELTVSIRIEGVSPLLIKDGRYKKTKGDDVSPDAIFISTVQPDDFRDLVRRALKETCQDFYIPGASIKGAWRSYLERTLRSLDDIPKVCDPLIQAKAPGEDGKQPAAQEPEPDSPYRSCSDRLMNKEEQAPEHPYRDSCPVCRLFGNTAQGSRVSITDCKCEKATPLLAENNAISRQTGAARAPFKTLVLRDAVFTGTLRLRNFELWHVGLVARLFDDMKEARVPLGAGKNKGWGRVRVTAVSIELAYFGVREALAAGKLRGCAELFSEAERDHYGIIAISEADLPVITATKDGQKSSLWRTVYMADTDDFWNLTRSCFDKSTWDRFRPLAELRPPSQDTSPRKVFPA